MKNFGGIVLAGGNATRLNPSTLSVNKHILPVYDKPMIYYSLSVLISAGIRDITIVCKNSDIDNLKKIIGDEKYLGIDIRYAIQNEPKGLPHAMIEGFKASNFENNLIVLGDNFIFGSEFFNKVESELQNFNNSTIFLKKMSNYSEFGVAAVKKNKIYDFVEKPKNRNVDYQVIIGLYKFNKEFISAYENIAPSKRNEYEIIDIFKILNDSDSLSYFEIGRGTTWYDVGTYDDLISCSNFVKEVQDRQKLSVCSPHEISFNKNLISKETFKEFIKINKETDYIKNLEKVFY